MGCDRQDVRGYYRFPLYSSCQPIMPAASGGQQQNVFMSVLTSQHATPGLSLGARGQHQGFCLGHSRARCVSLLLMPFVFPLDHLVQVLEAGTKAFVSFVRGYKEHHCKFIFRLQVRRSLYLVM